MIEVGEQMFSCYYERGTIIMTETKIEIIKLIFENDNPEEAIMTFAAIIDLLKQHEAFGEQVSECLQTSYQTSL